MRLAFGFGQKIFGYEREEFQKQDLLFVFGQFHSAAVLQYGVGLHLVFGGVVWRFLAGSGDLHAEFGIYFYGRMSVFALH